MRPAAIVCVLPIALPLLHVYGHRRDAPSADERVGGSREDDRVMQLQPIDKSSWQLRLFSLLRVIHHTIAAQRMIDIIQIVVFPESLRCTEYIHTSMLYIYIYIEAWFAAEETESLIWVRRFYCARNCFFTTIFMRERPH